MTPLDTLHAAGITDRQIDVWTSNQWIRPHTKGRGSPRVWPPEEIRVALLMKTLFDAGFAAVRAADIARRVETTRSLPGFDAVPVTVDLGEGVRLTIDTTRQEAAA